MSRRDEGNCSPFGVSGSIPRVSLVYDRNDYGSCLRIYHALLYGHNSLSKAKDPWQSHGIHRLPPACFVLHIVVQDASLNSGLNLGLWPEPHVRDRCVIVEDPLALAFDTIVFSSRILCFLCLYSFFD